MRILHCITALDFGGSERQLALLSRILPRYGWDVHVATLAGGRFEDSLDPSASLHRVTGRHVRDVRVALRLAGLIGRLRPAIVQTWLLPMDVFGGLAALARAVPWVASERSSALGYPACWSTRVRRWIVRRADALVANSAGGLELWTSGGGPRFCRVIRNGIDVESIDDRTRTPDSVIVADGSPTIVFSGRFVVEKRLDVLLRAMVRVRHSVPAVAVLCGTGPAEYDLRRLARELGIEDGVVFAGFVRDIRGVASGADVFVSVSAVEGSPNAVQEAMAWGTPVVLSDIGAHRELTTDHTASIVDGGNPLAVADAILDCIRDRPAARARAERAQSAARAWSAAAMGAEYDAFYRQILESRGR